MGKIIVKTIETELGNIEFSLDSETNKITTEYKGKLIPPKQNWRSLVEAEGVITEKYLNFFKKDREVNQKQFFINKYFNTDVDQYFYSAKEVDVFCRIGSDILLKDMKIISCKDLTEVFYDDFIEISSLIKITSDNIDSIKSKIEGLMDEIEIEANRVRQLVESKK